MGFVAGLFFGLCGLCFSVGFFCCLLRVCSLAGCWWCRGFVVWLFLVSVVSLFFGCSYFLVCVVGWFFGWLLDSVFCCPLLFDSLFLVCGSVCWIVS